MSEDDTTPLSERAVAASQGELNALLGRGARFEGKLAFEGKVRIDGHFRGEVISTGVLIVGDEAEIEGTIEVGTLIVRGGTVRAEIRATAAVEAYAPSRITGNITAVDVFIDKGVRFEGAITMTERDES
jgi:cytoskeletal protein CcmA (bactofilin family)